LLWGNDPRQARHRLTLYAATVRSARGLVSALNRRPVATGALAVVSLSLMNAATELAAAAGPPGRRGSEAADELRAHILDADVALFTGPGPAAGVAEHPARRPLIQLQQVLAELAGTGPADRPAVPIHAGRMREDGPAVAGHVRTPTGRAVADAALTLVDPSGRQLAQARSGADGGYRITPSGPGVYLLIALARLHDSTATWIVVADTTVALDVVLAGTAGLAGKVTTPGSVPVPGVALTLLDAGGQVLATGRSGPDGEYAFRDLTPGACTLVTSAAGHSPSARPIVLAEHGTTREDVELATGARLHGVARAGHDGRPVAHARITLLDATGTVVAVTDTDERGAYAQCKQR
jgi:hypothetical protein